MRALGNTHKSRHRICLGRKTCAIRGGSSDEETSQEEETQDDTSNNPPESNTFFTSDWFTHGFVITGDQVPGGGQIRFANGTGEFEVPNLSTLTYGNAGITNMLLAWKDGLITIDQLREWADKNLSGNNVMYVIDKNTVQIGSTSDSRVFYFVKEDSITSQPRDARLNILYQTRDGSWKDTKKNYPRVD